MQAEKKYGTHLESVNPTIRPEDFDVFITDINDENLIQISTELDSTYLSSSPKQYIFPLGGMLYGRNMRSFFLFAVQHLGKFLETLFSQYHLFI